MSAPDEKPPIPGKWKNVYAWLILINVAYLLFFFLFMKTFG